MVTNGISGNVSTYSAAMAPADVTSAKPEAAVTPVVAKPEVLQPKHDNVELTKTAKAKSLKLSGQTVAQIALSMGLDAKTVNSYLGVSTKAELATSPQPTTIAPQVKPEATGSAAQNATEITQG